MLAVFLLDASGVSAQKWGLYQKQGLTRVRDPKNMPLKSGVSSKTISANIRELHGGRTYEKTKMKYGKNKANKQAIAIALRESRQ